MAFVQVTRARGVTKDQYEAIREQATGAKLLDRELFLIDGYRGDELWILDGWATREQCDRGSEAWGQAMAAAGVSGEGMTTEEFDVDEMRLGNR